MLEAKSFKSCWTAYFHLYEDKKVVTEYCSPQDTCVALEALAKYSERTAGANLDLRISLTAERDSSWRRTVHITNQNALVMTQEDVGSL